MEAPVYEPEGDYVHDDEGDEAADKVEDVDEDEGAEEGLRAGEGCLKGVETKISRVVRSVYLEVDQ